MLFPVENKYEQGSARLHVLFAQDAHKAVILRHGPRIWTQQIAWDVDTDEFQFGQWVKGRINPSICDLSPSGNYLLYFVYRYGKADLGYRIFTAISKVPNFTALALWSLDDTWSGGGRFINEHTVWINHPKDKQQPHPQHISQLFTQVAELPEFFSKQPPNAWEPLHMASVAPVDAQGAIWQRKHFVLPYILIKKDISNSPVHYYLKTQESDEGQLLENVSWADFDQRGRLIMARFGMLLVCDLTQQPLNAHLLIDLNKQKPTIF